MAVKPILILGGMMVCIILLQSLSAFTYFSGFFQFKRKRKYFLAAMAAYMLLIKMVDLHVSIRISFMILYLLLVTMIFMYGSLAKKIYHVLTFTCTLTLLEFAFSIFFNPSGALHTEYIKGIFVYLMVNAIFFLLIILMIKSFLYFRKQDKEGLETQEYLLLGIVPVASFFLICLVMNLEYMAKITTSLCLLLINSSYVLLYDHLAKKNYKLNSLSLQDQQNVFYQEQIHNQTELLRFKHDCKHLFLALDYYLAKGMAEKAREEIQSHLDSGNLLHSPYSGCLAIDSVLSGKLRQIQQAGVDHQLQLQVPRDLNLAKDSAFDISIILGNLLDNAIEAVLRIPEPSCRQIRITIQYQEGKLNIHIRNASNPIGIDFSSNLIPSEKGKERYGIGINSIKERVRKLNGFYDFSYQEGQYTALVILPIP